MKKKIVFIGGGGHCRSVIDAARRMNCFAEMVITDPGLTEGILIDGCRVVGDDNRLAYLYEAGFTNAFITVGSLVDTASRRHAQKKAATCGFAFPSIVDTSAAVSEVADIGNGVFIGKLAVINAGALIKDHVIINTGAIVEHDCMIGAFSHVAVGAVVCGGVAIGEGVLIGAGATVVQGSIIGSASIIAAGSVVTRDIPANCMAAGVPAKVIKELTNG